MPVLTRGVPNDAQPKKRTRTPEQCAKIAAGHKARAESKVQRRGASLYIAGLEKGKGYRVFYLDDSNWIVCKETDFENEKGYHYYPDLEWALEYVILQTINVKMKPDIVGILNAIKEAKTSVIKAVRETNLQARLSMDE